GVLGTIKLHARSEGAWGNTLKAKLGFRTRNLIATPLAPGNFELQLNPAERLTVGTLLRLRLADNSHVLRFVAMIEDRGDSTTPRMHRIATLESPTPANIDSIEIVEAQLHLSDTAGNAESFNALGLHVEHPRWMATVLCKESRLVWPDFAWA